MTRIFNAATRNPAHRLASYVARQHPRNGRQCPPRPLHDRGMDGHNECWTLKHGLNVGQRVAHPHHGGTSAGSGISRLDDGGTLIHGISNLIIVRHMAMHQMPWFTHVLPPLTFLIPQVAQINTLPHTSPIKASYSPHVSLDSRTGSASSYASQTFPDRPHTTSLVAARAWLAWRGEITAMRQACVGVAQAAAAASATSQHKANCMIISENVENNGRE